MSRQRAEACQLNCWLQESPKSNICPLLKKKGGKATAEFNSILLSCYKFVVTNTGTRTVPTPLEGFFTTESSRLEKTFKDHRSLTNKLTYQAPSLSYIPSATSTRPKLSPPIIHQKFTEEIEQ